MLQKVQQFVRFATQSELEAAITLVPAALGWIRSPLSYSRTSNANTNTNKMWRTKTRVLLFEQKQEIAFYILSLCREINGYNARAILISFERSVSAPRLSSSNNRTLGHTTAFPFLLSRFAVRQLICISLSSGTWNDKIFSSNLAMSASNKKMQWHMCTLNGVLFMET